MKVFIRAQSEAAAASFKIQAIKALRGTADPSRDLKTSKELIEDVLNGQECAVEMHSKYVEDFVTEMARYYFIVTVDESAHVKMVTHIREAITLALDMKRYTVANELVNVLSYLSDKG